VSSGRWVECLVCGEGFSPRTGLQDLCSLRCLCRDPRRRTAYPMQLRQAAKKLEPTRRAA
jgi:hypothetical protein